MLLAQSTPAHTPGVAHHDLFREPWQSQLPVNGCFSLPISKASAERPMSTLRNAATPVYSTSQPLAMIQSDVSLGQRPVSEVIASPGLPATDTRPRRATTSALSSRQSTRSKTCFRLALPPPRQKHSIRFKPKLLLQVQQVSYTTRPVPKLDVLPSAFFGTLFGLKAHGMLNVRFSRCGPADVVIVPSDSYTAPSEDDEGQTALDASENRELVAAITLPKKDDRASGTGEICLAQGSRWDAISLPNGSYEFVSTSNGVRTVARWVLRRNRRGTSAADSTPDDTQKSFTFSLIDPATRRHPVIGWLNSKGVDVADRYRPVTSIAAQRSEIINVGSSNQAGQPQSDSKEGKTTIEMSDFLRTLIVVSSIYVSLREGWARNEISSSLESSTVNATPFSSRLPSPRNTVPQPADAAQDDIVKMKRRRSSQLTSLFEKTSNVFRRSLSLRSSRPPSARRTLGSDYISRVSSRRSSLLSDSPNESATRAEIHDNAFQQRFATMPYSRPKNDNRSLLTVADSGGVDSSDEEGPFDNSALRTGDEDTLLPRACSPSPEPSNPGATTVIPTTGGSQMPPTSKSKKWRRLSHWLKPTSGKNGKSL